MMKSGREELEQLYLVRPPNLSSIFHRLNAQVFLQLLEQEEKHARLDAIVASAVCRTFEHYLSENPRLSQVFTDTEVSLGLLLYCQCFESVC